MMQKKEDSRVTQINAGYRNSLKGPEASKRFQISTATTNFGPTVNNPVLVKESNDVFSVNVGGIRRNLKSRGGRFFIGLNR
jgi:hypothetical protein